MLEIVLLVIGLLLLLAITWFVMRFTGMDRSAEDKRRDKILDKIPGPYKRPIVGALFDLPRNQKDVLPWLMAIGETYKGMYVMSMGPEKKIFIGKNHFAAEILRGSKHSEKSGVYFALHRWLGLGLLTSKGAQWKARRKLITPAFHFDVLDKALTTMMKHNAIMIEKFEAFAEREQIADIWDDIALLGLDIISDAAMGVQLDAQLKNPDSLEYVRNRDEVTMLIIQRFRTIWLIGNFLYYNFFPSGMREKKLVNSLQKFTENVIVKRWKELQENIEEFQNKKRNSFLDLLLLARQENSLTIDDIRQEVDTFMFEGNDTTAVATSFVLLALADNPDIMRKLQEEADEKLAGVDLLDISEDNTQNVKKAIFSMPYLDAVLKEGLRMFPSVPTISRITSEDTEINGYLIPKGSGVGLHIYSIHHDPEVFKDPFCFRPERWLEKEVPIDEKPYCYIPFSAGPRNCIGQKFAQMQEKLIVASIARHFNLTSDLGLKDIHCYGQVILRPQEKFTMKFHRRLDE